MAQLNTNGHQIKWVISKLGRRRDIRHQTFEPNVEKLAGKWQGSANMPIGKKKKKLNEDDNSNCNNL